MIRPNIIRLCCKSKDIISNSCSSSISTSSTIGGVIGSQSIDINNIIKKKKNLIGLTKEELLKEFEQVGLKEKYRVDQVWQWMYNKGVKNIDHFDNISKSARQLLIDNFEINTGSINKDSLSLDGTRKMLIDFAGDEVESVFIPERTRGTLCVSSQVGCTFGCTFCYTGTQKLVRNLTVGEIVSQVLTTRSLLHDYGPTKERRLLSSLVFMGQGEPLYNYRNVSKALKIITDGTGISLSKSKITVSTSGVVPLIDRLGQDFPGIGLAISLHAANNTTRSQIVPINQQWPIEDLVAACINFSKNYTRGVTIEYVMLKGVNDSKQDANDLIKIAKEFPSLVNLIPFNKWPGTNYECSSTDTIEHFASILEKAGIKTTVRQPRGRDILAACGQLKTESIKVKKVLPDFKSDLNKLNQSI